MKRPAKADQPATVTIAGNGYVIGPTGIKDVCVAAAASHRGHLIPLDLVTVVDRHGNEVPRDQWPSCSAIKPNDPLHVWTHRKDNR